MQPECPKCGSDAAVTSTTVGGLVTYTCRFSHGGEGHVTWTGGKVRAPAATPRTPRAPKARPAPAADSAAAVNARAIDAFRAEVARRGGQATVRRAGNRNEVVVKPKGIGLEFQVSVRSRTSGDFQTSTTYGKARRPEEFPTRFWVFVDLFHDGTNFYIVPEWWIQNDILEKHQQFLDAHDGSRPVNDDSTHHGITTERIAEWAGKWRQIGL